MAEFDLQEELQSIQDLENYTINNEHDLSSMDPRGIAALLEQVVATIAESHDNITDPSTFDIYRSFLKYADALPGALMPKLLDSILSGFSTEVDSTVHDVDHEDQQTYLAHKAPLEMYAFLLNWFVGAAEKVKGSGSDEAPPVRARRGRGGKAAAARGARQRGTEWSYVDQIPAVLAAISKALRLKSNKVWTTTPERDTFIGCITRPAYHITESETYMKSNEIKMGAYKVICLAVKHHGHALAAQISIMQSLQYYEHLSEPMAECLTVLAKEFDHAQLGDEVLREIAGKAFNAQDTKGPRAFSRFLVKYAECVPRAILKQISLLLAHLDSESYPMRMALVEVLGTLIRELAISADIATDAAQTQKQLVNLYDLLLSHTLDLNSYVRTKVFQVLGRLCDLPVKFPKQRLSMTRAAVAALEDKSSGVRKAAVGLLVRLTVTHPYGLMHGGLLGLREWEERYRTVSEDLAKVEKKLGVGMGGEEAEEGEKEGEEEEGEADGEEEDAEEGEGRKKGKKRSRRGRQGSDEEMDVDEEADDAEADEEEEEEEAEEAEASQFADEDVEMADGDGEQRPKKKSKAKKKKRKSTADAHQPLNLAELTDEQAALAALESNQMLHLKLRKRYYAEGLNFIRQIEGAMEIIGQLLGSTSKAEVLEAMEFFRVTHEYQFDSAEAGIKKMLHLIWSKDNNAMSEDGKELKGVRSRLLECYRSLYFDALPDMEPKQQVNRIAKNMIELTYGATLAELTSLEEMMRYMMDDGQIHGDVIGKLWQVYSSERPLPKQQRRGAIIILGMLALARRSVVADRVETLLKIGLGPLGKSDLTLAKYTCVALQRFNGSAKKIKGSLLDMTVRIEMGNSIFRKLQDAIEHPCRSRDWFGFAEQVINTVYALGEHPDELSDTIIKNLTKRAFTRRPPPPPAEDVDIEKPGGEEDAMDEDEPARERSNSDSQKGISQSQGSAPAGPAKDGGDAFALSQLLFVVGHVAIKHIVYLELVEREWKRQKHEKETAEKLAMNQGAPKSKDGEELDQVAGNAEDEIGERIAGVRETELLYGEQSLLQLFGPMLVQICGSPHKFKNRTLRAAATLSFSKFLCVSSKFCDDHHRLLFKILETSKDANIRSNIVIALGDVAVSFSSIIDENSNELYKGLSDGDLVVKKNTLMVLTHLILNGMVKVKGQLGEMAKCLEDEEPRIADLAKLFFTELSTKDNAIYNNLPDVISHLSVGDHAVDEETFQSTMKYIFTFIEKACNLFSFPSYC
ncbi:hypothetical protein EWM64_g7334 [Hericium alpestre]|uniref:Condensin complex subunit 1 n=1 Tax=Hericium alpestre TaxID=135208 RepID=A0A4Y9ZT59_9AGAM|nr:hypothetical protein EWM64_g7334 [Hericium alpestre]